MNDSREQYLARAQAIDIPLQRRTVRPVALGRPVRENGRTSWQTEAPVSDFIGRDLPEGESVCLDFGVHVVGRLHFHLANGSEPEQAPVRLRFTFAEYPVELEEPEGNYTGLLAQSWIQDEIVTLDEINREVALPRRYAFNYLRIEMVSSSFRCRFTDLSVETTSAVDADAVPPLDCPDATLRAIDRVSIRTLAECMQRVFEDGPKRDRRLWIGDLRLQALLNDVTFRHRDLAERSLYLLAAAADADGNLSACAYDSGRIVISAPIVDYSLLFGDILLNHLASYGPRPVVGELYETAIRQVAAVRRYFDAAGIFRKPADKWLFIDWHQTLDRQAPMQGVYLYALRRNASLAEQLGRADDAVAFRNEATRLTAAARSHFYRDGVIRADGEDAELSYAAQIWMILAQVLTPEEGKRALKIVEDTPDAIKPVTPYLWHHYVTALLACGRREKALAFIREYWGGMLAENDRTFGEVFVPGESGYTPYGDPRLNSACHAWSCTPAYFLRTVFFNNGNQNA